MHSAATGDVAGTPEYGPFQLTALVGLRMLVGWHFMYEGLAKITNPFWTSAGYLEQSQGWFEDQFLALATSPGALTVVDYLNQWGLLLVGLALLIGAFARPAALAGALMLLLYYVAAPPFPGLEYSIPTEGSYMIVNKILVELAALLVIFAFPTSRQVGLDRLIFRRRQATSVA
jgi:thiosulfate dehydrogenase [quinone] large subunit